MRKYTLLPLTLLLLAFVTSCAVKSTGATSSTPEGKIKEIESSDEIVWLDYNEAVKLAQHKPKKIFVDVYTNWCGWCKRMDATTLKDSKITSYMNDKYYAVKLNAESNNKLTYKGKEMTEAELAKNVFQATGYPTTVYLNEEQEILQPVPGYLDVDMMNKILHFYGDDHFKSKSWDRFKMSFNSEE